MPFAPASFHPSPSLAAPLQFRVFRPAARFNPKGIASQSPGLRGTSYPGSTPPKDHNPERVAPMRGTTVKGAPQPRWGCKSNRRLPRVARASQPWAGGWNPVGIHPRFVPTFLSAAGVARKVFHCPGAAVHFSRRPPERPHVANFFVVVRMADLAASAFQVTYRVGIVIGGPIAALWS